MSKKILDYGCGFGGNIKYLAKRGDYIGVDLLAENIEYAKKRYGEKFFKKSDGLNFPPESFDEIHLYDVLEHVNDLNGTLSLVSDWCKKGGKIFITVPENVSEKMLLKIRPEYFNEVGHLRIVDPLQLSKMFSKLGFVKIKDYGDRGMEALMLAYLFKSNAKKRMVAYQTGSPQFSKMAVAFIWLFDTRLFRTALKYLFFLYIFTLPVGWVISRFMPKCRYMVFQKNYA